MHSNPCFEAPLCFILLPAIGAYLLGLGLRASHQSAHAWHGVAVHEVPLWVRGLRWSSLPLFPGSVGILSLHATAANAAPAAETLLDALRQSNEDGCDRCGVCGTSGRLHIRKILCYLPGAPTGP